MVDTLSEPLSGARLVPGNVPLYRQLGRILREAILDDRFPAGSTLPTEERLTQLYGVSRVTVRQALQDLAVEGLVRRQRPKGTVVLDKHLPAGAGWKFDSLQDVVAFGEQTRVQILSFDEQEAPEAVSRIFGFAHPARLRRVHGLRHLNGEPLSEFAFWLTPSVASQLSREDLSRPTLFGTIETKLGIRLTEAQQTVWCEPAGQRIARMLRLPRAAPVLAIQRIYLAAGGIPVEVAISRFRGDRYRLQYALRRA